MAERPHGSIKRGQSTRLRSWRVASTFLCIASIAGLTIGLVVEHRARTKLEKERDALERQLDHMARLITENGQLSNLVEQARFRQPEANVPSREILRLRGQLGVLRQSTKELESVRNENRRFRAALESSQNIQSSGSASTDYWPRNSWAFAGYASPDAALRSSIWACNNGDLKALLASSTGEFRQMIEKDCEGKSESEASIRAMDQISGLKSVRVLNRDVQGDDTVVLTLAFEGGTEVHTDNLLMKKIGGDWKVSGPPGD